MPSRPLPIFVDTHAVLTNTLAWIRVTRASAIQATHRGLLVVVLPAPVGVATRFDDHSPFWYATGPHDYSALRYFVHRESRPARGMPGSGSPQMPAPKSVSPEVEPELVPLEEPEEERSRKLTVEKKRELRFDLALDPSAPGIEDDSFVLASADGAYRQVRTVKDDKVPGDKKLSLVFTDVEEGRTYSLSQMQGGGETVLVPEVSYDGGKPPSKSGPGEVLGCKAVFRECLIKGEKENLYQEKEGEYLIEIAPATGKWVYVFGGPQGKPYRLLAEGLGESDGRFRPVDLARFAGEAEREPNAQSSAWITLPLLVNGKPWDLFACLSPFQLPWKRIEQLAKHPQSRCYKIGTREGGILWAPGHLGRDVPRLLDLRDQRVKDPGNDAMLVGLIDPMAEAKRRADIYRKRAEPYLEFRFDIPPIGGKPASPAERRRKYVAGLLKVLVEQHPDKKNLRAALADNGLGLDSYLVELNNRELYLKKKAEKAGAALVKWMDHPSGLFESTLHDYTADADETDLWRKAKEDFAYLIRYFDVTALTRLYSRKITDGKDAWVMRYILGEEAHQAARKLTGATAEILSWLGKVMVTRSDFKLKMLEEVYGRFVPGWEFEYRQVSTLEHKTLITEYFPDERVEKPVALREKYWEAFESPGSRREVSVIRLTDRCKPMEKLEKVADSKVAKSLVFGLEGVNLVLSFFNDKPNTAERVTAISGGMMDMFIVVAESFKIAGRGFLSALGGVSAGIDFYFAIDQAREDAADGDYDAMVAQAVIATGSASLAVGSVIVATTLFSSLTWANLSLNAIFTVGGSISATGAGAPAGAALILAGIALVAAGSVAYLLAKDSELEKWVKACPFGNFPGWSYSDEISAPLRIWELSQQLIPWKVSATHAFLNGQSDYVLSIQGPLNPYSKITVRALDFMDHLGQRTRFLQDEVIRPVESRNLRIMTTLGAPTSVSLHFKDSACWAAHKQRFPSAGNGFKLCGLQIHIDQNGDGQILWFPQAEKNTLVFEV